MSILPVTYCYPTPLHGSSEKDGGGKKAKNHTETITLLAKKKPFLRASENLQHLNFGSHHWNYNWIHVLTDETKIFLQNWAAQRKSNGG